MAYVTGTANSFADLLTALRNACTTNGWTLSGEILHKGTCYVQTRVGENGSTDTSPVPPANSMLIVRIGNGKDGSNILTDTPHGTLGGPRMGRIKDTVSNTYLDWDWPVTYHIHVNVSPDEVVMIVNYGSGQYFQTVMFGQSPSPGNAGTGNWAGGTVPNVVGGYGGSPFSNANIGMMASGTFSLYAGSYWCPFPFWQTSDGGLTGTPANGCIHGAVNSSGATIWSSVTAMPYFGANDGVTASAPLEPLALRSPNAWNSEAILLPMQLLQARPSSKSSIIGEFKHIRLVRNDFIDNGTVLIYGSDKWKVYPAFKKNAAVREGQGITHSGTFAVAIRYDGP